MKWKANKKIEESRRVQWFHSCKRWAASISV